MRKICFLLALLLVAAGEPVYFNREPPTRGTPGSSEFGYGTVLEINGAYLNDALALAADLPVDWLSIPLTWHEYSAEPGTGAAWQRLDGVMRFAAHEDIAVMLSLTGAPAAATGAQGPDPAMTAAFVETLARRYPALQAVELFAGANTRAGWGKNPDPAAYLRLYRAVQAQLVASRQNLLLVAGGLKPARTSLASQEMDDLIFLKELLAAARTDPLPVISLDLSALSGDPLASPESSLTALRRYELVRQVMTAHDHQKSLIWVTAFRPPSGTIRSQDPRARTYPTEPSNWLFQAYTQLRSQLYVGVVFYQSINPETGAADRSSTLIINEQEYHPFYSVLRELIAQNAPESSSMQKGRPKDGVIRKQ